MNNKTVITAIFLWGTLFFSYNAPNKVDVDHYILQKNGQRISDNINSGDSLTIQCNSIDKYRVAVNIKGHSGALLGPSFNPITGGDVPLNSLDPQISSVVCGE